MKSRSLILNALKHLNTQRFLLFFSFLLSFLFISSSNAFSQSCHADHDHETCTGLEAAPFNGHFYTPPANWILEKMNTPSQSLIGDPPCSTIDVTYIGFTPEAEAAFQYAVEIWETILSSPVDITIEANWEELSPGILGSTGTNFERNFTNAPTTDYYAASIANQIAGSDVSPGSFDMFMTFSSVFDWYLGTDGNPASTEYDFVTVVLHEIGHGLGFVSSKGYNSSTGVGDFGLGSTTIPINYDRFLTLGSFGTDLLDLSGTALGDAFTGGNVFNSAPLAVAANGGVSPKIYAPSTYAGGSSISHWDEATYPAGDPNSLMTPQVGAGEAIHDPGVISIGLLEDLGWTICYGITEVPNDLPCNALPIECGETVSGDTELATFSGVDFTCSGDYLDVFYSFEGIPGVEYTVSVNGDTYDGILAAYTGACDGTLTSLACADDGTSPGIEETISFTIASPQTVLIQTAGWSGTAAFNLSLACEVINDNPCNAIALSTDGTVSIYTNVGATADVDEVVPPGTGCQTQDGWCSAQATIENSVWFSFIAPPSGRVNVLTCNAGATFDTQIAIYAAENCGDYLTYALLSANDDVTCSEQLYASSAFTCVIPGTEYYVQVDGYNGAVGSIAISISEEDGTECGPTDDDCANTAQFGGVTLDGTDALLTITTCAFEQEYSIIENSITGDEYTFDVISEFGQYLTVRSGTFDGPVLGSGFSPLTVTSDIDGSLFVHYNTDEFCGTSSGNCVSSTVQCISCTLDCPLLGGNIGEPCDDGNPTTENDVITPDCSCVGTSIFDCPDLSANIGDACNDGNPETENDMITADCNCEGTIPPPPNDLCENAEPLTVNLPGDCAGNETEGTTEGAGSAGFALNCEPGNPEVFYSFNSGERTSIQFNTQFLSATDLILTVFEGGCDGENIFCSTLVSPLLSVTPFTDYTVRISTNLGFGEVGTFSICLEGTFECPDLAANIGDTCDDGNVNTINDVVTADCNCEGEIPAATASLLTLPCGGQVIQITGALSGATGGGTATSETRTVYSFAPDGIGAINPSYSGTAWPYVLIGSTIDISPDISASITFNELGYLSVNGRLAYQFIGDASAADANGPGGPWSYFLPNGDISQDACPEVFDCPILSLNIGDACDDGDSNTINDTVDADCNCAGEPQTGSLSGTADWNNSCGDRGLTIDFYEPSTPILVASYSTSIDENGDFSLTDIPVGTFDIYAKIDGRLANGYYNETIALGANSLALGSFIPGDLNNNNGINITDFSLLNIAFGSSEGDANYNNLADMNCDGNVNIIDVSILNIGFGQVGDSPGAP